MSSPSESYTPSSLLTHIVVGCAGMLAAVSVPSFSGAFTLFLVAMLVLGLAFAANRYLRSRTRSGLEIVENAVVTGEKPPGTTEFHQTANNIVTHVSRLAAVAAKGRDQCREVESVLVAFDRRTSGGTGKANPSRQLTLLLQSLGNDAQKLVGRIFSCGQDMQVINESLLDANDTQNDLVKTAALQIDQLAQSVETVNSNTKRAKSKDSETTKVAESVSSRLLAFQRNLESLRDFIVNCEKKTHVLRDQTTEIMTLIRSINEYATKTDTMALNASIESVRAGEHGRGFAAAADEIRKLTGIISESAQSVVDRLNLVEGEAKETNQLCAEGQDAIDAQLAVARRLTESMSEIRQTTNQSREHLEKVLQKSDGQLQNVTAVAEALDGILIAADGMAAQIEVETTKRNELTTALSDLSGLLAPLAGSTRNAAPHPARQGAPAAATELAPTEQLVAAE